MLSELEIRAEELSEKSVAFGSPHPNAVGFRSHPEAVAFGSPHPKAVGFGSPCPKPVGFALPTSLFGSNLATSSFNKTSNNYTAAHSLPSFGGYKFQEYSSFDSSPSTLQAPRIATSSLFGSSSNINNTFPPCHPLPASIPLSRTAAIISDDLCETSNNYSPCIPSRSPDKRSYRIRQKKEDLYEENVSLLLINIHITKNLKEWLACKGGLPLCSSVLQHMQIQARKINNISAREILDCFSYDPKEYMELHQLSFVEDSEFAEILRSIDRNGGYCEESECIKFNILKNLFMPILEDAGLKSLGEKAVEDIRYMLATLSFLIYTVHWFLQDTKQNISGSYDHEKLNNLAQLLASCIIKFIPKTNIFLKALRFVTYIEQKHSLVYQLLDNIPNWEVYIVEFIKTQSLKKTSIPWDDIIVERNNLEQSSSNVLIP